MFSIESLVDLSENFDRFYVEFYRRRVLDVVF